MWTDFHRVVEPLAADPEVVRQLKAKLMHMTLLIKEACYPVPKRDTLPPKPADPSATQAKKEKVVWSLDSKEAADKSVVRDANLQAQQWNVDMLLWLWHALLHTLHNVNNFKSPKMHEGAMNVITDVLDLLIQAEDTTALERPDDPEPRPQRVPLVSVFGQYLFAACKLEDPARVGGITLAFGAICRLFCRRTPAFPLRLLSHFYNVIRTGLMSTEKSIWWTIIVNSYNIFSLALPGASSLIPYYVSKAKELLLATTAPPLSAPNGKQKLVSLLSSLICHPAHFPSASVPSLVGKGKSFTSAMLRDEIHSTLIASLYVPQIPSESRVMSLWSIVACITEEFAHFDGAKVSELTHAIMAFVGGDDTQVTQAALQALSFLAKFGSRMQPELSNVIVDCLCTAALTQCMPDSLMPFVYLTLADWIVADLPPFAIREQTQHKLCMTMEYGLVVGSPPPSFSPQLPGGDALAMSSVSSPSDERARKQRTLRKKFALASLVKERSVTEMSLPKAATAASGGSSGGSPTMLEEEGTLERDRRLSVREAAEILVGHALHFRNNYPAREGADVSCSRVCEADDDGAEDTASHWIHHGQSLVSVVEVPPSAATITTVHGTHGAKVARLVVRESAGKWAWDFSPVRVAAESGLPDAVLNVDASQPSLSSPIDEAIDSSKLSATRTRTRTATHGQGFMLAQKNKVSELFEELHRAHPELQVWTGPFGQPEAALSKFRQSLAEMEQHMLTLRKNEGVAAQSVHPPHACSNAPESPAAMPIDVGARATTSRLLLQQLGFVSPLSPIMPMFDRLLPSEKYKRHVGLLDKAPGRSVHKIGLIYVREGQDSQNEILANSLGSPLYTDFVSGLGWPVDVATHRGYLGGLDKNCTYGNRTLYWADSITEVIFHEVVRMPTIEGDAQQILKKKHVGNDFVHIIWCEHLRDYNPLTITSQFNEAHIVLYPLHNGLVRVQVFRNPVNSLFGPL
jgi:hypothetical protein